MTWGIEVLKFQDGACNVMGRDECTYEKFPSFMRHISETLHSKRDAAIYCSYKRGFAKSFDVAKSTLQIHVSFYNTLKVEETCETIT